MRQSYRGWLESQKYDAGTIATQLHRSGRVEKHYGDLDQHYENDRLRNVVSTLKYSAEDKRRGRSNPSKIPFDGDIYNNLASYRNAVERYVTFREAGFEASNLIVSSTPNPLIESKTIKPLNEAVEELGQRIGLERDMQATLRLAINDLEEGLQIIDEGAERYVESGRIDITARDKSGATVVIELKAGDAGQRAVAQILSYMGDIAAEEPDTHVRGILIASGFDGKAKAASRMVSSLSLVSYGVKFLFSKITP